MDNIQAGRLAETFFARYPPERCGINHAYCEMLNLMFGTGEEKYRTDQNPYARQFLELIRKAEDSIQIRDESMYDEFNARYLSWCISLLTDTRQAGPADFYTELEKIREDLEKKMTRYSDDHRHVNSFFEKDNCLGSNTFLPAFKAEFFCGGGLHRNIFLRRSENTCNDSLHGRNVIFDFGFLQDQDAVEIDNVISFVFYQGNCVFKENFTVNAFIFLRGIGKMVSDVAKCQCTKQSIADGMQQNIGIGMAEKPFGVIDFNSAKEKGKAISIVDEHHNLSRS